MRNSSLSTGTEILKPWEKCSTHPEKKITITGLRQNCFRDFFGYAQLLLTNPGCSTIVPVSAVLGTWEAFWSLSTICVTSQYHMLTCRFLKEKEIGRTNVYFWYPTFFCKNRRKMWLSTITEPLRFKGYGYESTNSKICATPWYRRKSYFIWHTEYNFIHTNLGTELHSDQERLSTS